jgi:DNA damage-inducible protein 1
MEAALEYNPEAFGRVHMLYIDVEVNGHPVKAFVDSGAQATIMSPDCAEACGLMRLLDKRFAGIARGVGTARILGRVHSAQIRIGSLYLACSFTVMEGRGVDLLFGLDMLKRHQAIIDLSKDALIIGGETVMFLPEHQLPAAARFDELTEEEKAQLEPKPSTSNAVPSLPPRPTNVVTEDKIAAVMSLGVDRASAIAALKQANGNVDLAASLFFQ